MRILDRLAIELPVLSREERVATLPKVVEEAVVVEIKRRRSPRWVLFAVVATLLLLLDLQTSWLQARVFHWVAYQASYELRQGEHITLSPARKGPYDERLGYARVEDFVQRLKAAGFRVEAQARPSILLWQLAAVGITPPFVEKDRAGLRILGPGGTVLYEFHTPRNIYRQFEEIPPVVVRMLLFVENREALQSHFPYRNPAIEWDRLGKAVLDMTLNTLYPAHPVSGGSTLAVQLEKLRHSPGGRTTSALEKARQVVSASLRVYRQDLDTRTERREVVRAYLNSLPLGAVAGYGEVYGLGDGLKAWFDSDFARVNQLLWKLEQPGQADPTLLDEQARALQQVLLLILAAKRPSQLLGTRRDELEHRYRKYLQLFRKEKLVPEEVLDRASRLPVRLEGRPVELPGRSWAERKGVDSVRIQLMQLLGLEQLYDVDRLDLEAETTVHPRAQRWAATFIERLADPQFAAEQGLYGFRLLAPGQDPSSVIYSFVLYEVTPQGNVLRVQADNLQQPLNFNEHTKLELGSTAKLRTLATYLEVIAELYQRYAGQSPERLGEARLQADDPLTSWVLDYLAEHPTATLNDILRAAMERKYSASPAETFFTAGGAHRFSNFDPADNGRILTVREAFHRSVNLVFIRLMRDLVEYHIRRLPNYDPKIFTDMHDPRRQRYLARFIEWESRQFLTEFYGKYQGLGVEEALYKRAQEMKPATPRRLAALYRWVRPQVGIDGFAAFLLSVLLNPNLPDKLIQELYEDYAPGRFNLQDQAYLAGVHPLELWLLRYLAEHPNASLEEVLAASRAVQADSYRWLLRPQRKAAQDRGIRIILEQDAFVEIHRRWKRLGYPFRRLIPSYATSIGVSGDTPAALAELMGIILNDGVYKPTYRLHRLTLGSGTPYEVRLRYEPAAPRRVMLPEIAQILREELAGVVLYGTAKRAAPGVVGPDGRILPVGGKTGTGDNRYEMYGRHGEVLRSLVRNRTATFVFYVGDRWFGTITAFVPEEAARQFEFTSSLPVQVFKQLVPTLIAELTRG